MPDPTIFGFNRNKPTHEQLADLFAEYIDKANDPRSRGSIRDRSFFDRFEQIAPAARFGYSPNDIGTLQQNPQYRGIRMVLPQSGGTYGDIATRNGGLLSEEGKPRVMTQGPIGEPDPLDPHSNGLRRYPPNYPPDMGGLREMVYGELIKRGYPIFGGTGDFGGDFQPGFNPIGFGQRNIGAPSEQEQLNRDAELMQRLPRTPPKRPMFNFR